jgi:deoxycytidylate deaminase
MTPHQLPDGEWVCEHGTAVDVHCCNCHSGFLFDADACVCGEYGMDTRNGDIYQSRELAEAAGVPDEDLVTGSKAAIRETLGQDQGARSARQLQERRRPHDGRPAAMTDDTRRRLDAAPPPDIVAAAMRAAAHSPCRSKRGAAAFTGNGLIATGFNYRPDGCPGTAKCKATCRLTAVHAEQDAILQAGPMALHAAEMLHVKSVDGVLVPSGGPSCVSCSKVILHANMAAVWLYHEDGWRRYQAHEFHRLSLAALPAEPPPDLVALVLALQAHAKEHGWQDVDEPIAALLAYPLPAARDTTGGTDAKV